MWSVVKFIVDIFCLVGAIVFLAFIIGAAAKMVFPFLMYIVLFVVIIMAITRGLYLISGGD